MATASAERRQRLIEEAGDAAAFIKLGHDLPFHAQDIEEVLESMSSDDCLRVWDALAQHVRADFDAENQETLAVIDAICSFGCAYLKAVPKQAPESLQAIVQTLHDSLLRVEFESDVQDTMSRLCEAWYLAEPESRRHVVPQTILYLLLHSVGEKGKLADVKRVCAMREALLCIHIGGESFQSVQESFMRAAIHPNYVMHDEGRRFLAFVLSLQPQLTRALHQTIKSQLPRCRKSMLLQYGELYHTAWKRATGPVLHALEHDCLQDLASHAINTASPALSAAIRHLLSVFHNKKKFKAVDEMLARIYEPILWRSFKVANAAIRVQAAQLLAEAFPVQNPEASAKDFEEGLTRQIAVLDALLKDNVPRVREVGVQCVCRVLSVYLELVPLHTATSFLGTLIKHLSMDSSAAAVRVAVLRGLAVVLDNHVSHALLAARLPLLAERIHDSCESVRVAMAELLLKVRGVKGIRFFDVVALPDILSRLAADAGRPAVAKRLTKLLMPSYMPLNKPGAERLARILALVQQDQQAAQVFLREAGAEAPAQEALKLLSLMRHALARHLGHESEVAESPLKRKGKARESQASPHTVDIQVVEGLVLCMSALAQSLRRGVDDMPQAGEAKQQEEAGEVRQELAQALAGQCDRLHALVAADSSLPLSLEARCAVWSLLALGGSGIGQEGGDAGMERFVINAWRRGGALEMQAAMQCVLSLPPEAGAESRASLTKSLLLPLTTGVKHYLESVEGGKLCDSNKACKQRKTGKHKAASSVQPREVEASSGYGIEVLERIKALLACSSLRKRLLASPSSLSGLVKAFDGLRPLLEARLGMSGEAPAPVPGLEQAVELYGSLLLHLQCAQYPGEAGAGKAPQGLCAFIDTLVRSAPPASADPGDSSELWRQTASAVLLVCADACALNRCDQALAGGMCSLIQKAAEMEMAACLTLGGDPDGDASKAPAGAGARQASASSKNDSASASLLHAISKASFQLVRVGMELERMSATVGDMLESLPKHRLRLVGEVVGELLRVSSLRAEHAEEEASDNGTTLDKLGKLEEPPPPPAGHALRLATHDLVHCCLRRLEVCEAFDDGQEGGRPEEAADRLVSAAASVGHEALLLIVQEVCTELEQGMDASRGKAGADLSRLAAALALAHAVAARPRAFLRAAQHGAGGKAGCLDALVRGVQRVLAALEERAADFAPGKRGLQAASVAAHAQRCLGSLGEIKPQGAVARA